MSIRRISQRAKDEKTRKLLSRIIRVDQAGELGADRIYAGQIAVLGNTPVGPRYVIVEVRTRGSVNQH